MQNLNEIENHDEGTMETDNQPEVTSSTQFARRGFAPPPEEGSEGEEVTEEAEFEMQGEPEGEVEAAAEDESEAKIRIGDRSFRNQQEAFDYAAELEREKLANDAFRQGIEAASSGQKGNQITEAPPEDKFEEEFYADPKAYLNKVRQQAKDEIKQELSQEAQRAQSYKQTWDGFYSDYPDLQSAKTLVEAVLQRNWNDLHLIETKKALKILAEKVRAEKRTMFEAELPRTQMSGQKRTTSAGGPANVTRGKVPEKNLSFAAQIRNNKSKRTARA